MFVVKQCDLLSSNRMSVTNVDTTKHKTLLHHVHIVKQSFVSQKTPFQVGYRYLQLELCS